MLSRAQGSNRGEELKGSPAKTTTEPEWRRRPAEPQERGPWKNSRLNRQSSSVDSVPPLDTTRKLEALLSDSTSPHQISVTSRSDPNLRFSNPKPSISPNKVSVRQAIESAIEEDWDAEESKSTNIWGDIQKLRHSIEIEVSSEEALSEENRRLHKRVSELEGRKAKEQIISDENNTLREQVRGLERQIRTANLDSDILTSTLSELKDENITLRTEWKQEKDRLILQVNELQKQLEDAKGQIEKRDDRSLRLGNTAWGRGIYTRELEPAVHQKDKIIQGLQRANEVLMKQKEDLQAQVDANMVQTGNTIPDSCHSTRISPTKLPDDDKPHIKFNPELHSSPHSDLQQSSLLQENLAFPAQDIANAPRTQLERTIISLRDQIVELEAEHSRNIYQSRIQAISKVNEAKQQALRLEEELDIAEEKLRDFRDRYETSERARKVLQDRVTRRQL